MTVTQPNVPPVERCEHGVQRWLQCRECNVLFSPLCEDDAISMHSLIPAYVAMHEKGDFPGISIKLYLEQIAELVRETGAETLLDYGCGKGHQYTLKRWHEAWGIMPALYDPAVPELSVLPPGPFDGVICTDVLEHVPGDELEQVIGDLVRLSQLWCFVSVCCRPAKKKRKLPDGRGVHVTLESEAWWEEVLGRAFDGRAVLILRFTP